MEEIDHINRNKPKKEIICKCGIKTTKGIKGKCRSCYQKGKTKRRNELKMYGLI